MKPKFIIGIGGSAGALNPIISFFDNTPLNHSAYVIIRHLPSEFRSMLGEILKRHSDLSIVDIKNGMVLKNNVIYIAPSDEYVSIEDNKFRLHKREHGVNIGVDKFFFRLLSTMARRWPSFYQGVAAMVKKVCWK